MPDCCTTHCTDLGSAIVTPSRIGYTYPSATPTGRGAHVLDSIGAADPRAWHVRCRRPSVRIYTRRRDHLPALVAWCPTYSVLLYTPRLLLRKLWRIVQRSFRSFSSTSPSRLGKFLALPYGQSSRGPHTYVHGTGVLVALVAVVVCHGLHGGQCGQWWPVSRWSPPLPSLHLHGLHGLHLCQWFHWWHWWPVSTASMVVAVVVSSVSVVASFTASVVVS